MEVVAVAHQHSKVILAIIIVIHLQNLVEHLSLLSNSNKMLILILTKAIITSKPTAIPSLKIIDQIPNHSIIAPIVSFKEILLQTNQIITKEEVCQVITIPTSSIQIITVFRIVLLTLVIDRINLGLQVMIKIKGQVIHLCQIMQIQTSIVDLMQEELAAIIAIILQITITEEVKIILVIMHSLLVNHLPITIKIKVAQMMIMMICSVLEEEKYSKLQEASMANEKCEVISVT